MERQSTDVFVAGSVIGSPLPSIALQATNGDQINLAEQRGSVILFFYPMTGRPDWPYPEELDAIPLASGCTGQVCAYRDARGHFAEAGVQVFGVSSQTPEYQMECAERLGLNFPLLSDSALLLADALALPLYETSVGPVYQRLTLEVGNGRITRATYPILVPEEDAAFQLDALQQGHDRP